MSVNVVWKRILQFFPELVKGLSGAAPVIDWTQGSTQSVTLNAATVTPTFVNPPGGCNLTLVATMDGTGGRAVVWPAAVSWIGGSSPTLLSGAGQTTLVNFYYDGTTYFGWLATAASPSSLLPWTDVAAGTALAASLAAPNLSCDSSAAQTNVTLPSAAQMAAADGFEFTVKATGNMLSPVIVTAGAGTTVELLNAPGTFGASTWMPIQGQCVVYKYDKVTTSFKVKGASYEGGAPGTSAYNSGWYARATIAVDPLNSSGVALDSNAGSNAAPLRTYAEAVRRWGSNAPLFTFATVGATWALTFLSSHTDDSDPVIFDGTFVGAIQPSIQGAAPASVAAVFTRTTAKNRAAGANALLAGSFSAGVPAVGKMIQNTTAGKSSRAFVYKTAGGANWTMTQPLALGGIATALPQAEVDSWASTDTVNVLTPVAVNLVRVNVTIENSALPLVLYQLTAFDPTAPNTNQVDFGGAIRLVECLFQRKVLYSRAPSSAQQFLSNVMTLGNETSVSGAPIRLAGASAGSLNVLNGITVIFDGDCIIGATTLFEYGTPVFGLVAIDALILVSTGTLTQLTEFYGSTVVYGTAGGSVMLGGMSCDSMESGGTFAACFTAPGLVTGILLNGAATGNSAAYAGNVATIHNGITTTPAHLDAAAGATGFGGVAFNLGGASVTTT